MKNSKKICIFLIFCIVLKLSESMESNETIYDATKQGSLNGAGWGGFVMRGLIEANAINNTGNPIRISFLAHELYSPFGNQGFAYIGEVVDSELRVVTNITNITWNGGSNTFNINAGETILSDWINYTITTNKNYSITMWSSSNANSRSPYSPEEEGIFAYGYNSNQETLLDDLNWTDDTVNSYRLQYVGAVEIDGVIETSYACSVDTDCGFCQKCETGNCVNETDNEDTKSECEILPTCSNAYVLSSYSGFCDGAGACDTNDVLINVSAGNVCISGSDTNPNATVNCGNWSDCVNGFINADEYYVGYAGDGTATCVDTDWQATGTQYTAPPTYMINKTEHADECQITLNCTTMWSCNGYGTCNTTDLRPCNSTEDLNLCGLPYAGNYSEFTSLSCNYCTATWNSTNGSCVDDYETITYQYTNTCCSQTGLPSDCNIPANGTQYCGSIEYGDASDFTGAVIDIGAKTIVSFGAFAVLIGLAIVVGIGIYAWKKVK